MDICRVAERRSEQFFSVCTTQVNSYRQENLLHFFKLRIKTKREGILFLNSCSEVNSILVYTIEY